jgi:hypothetical protein
LVVAQLLNHFFFTVIMCEERNNAPNLATVPAELQNHRFSFLEKPPQLLELACMLRDLMETALQVYRHKRQYHLSAHDLKESPSDIDDYDALRTFLADATAAWQIHNLRLTFSPNDVQHLPTHPSLPEMLRLLSKL